MKVVLDDFQYIESDQNHIPAGEHCSKHCQGEGDCIGGRCNSRGNSPSTNLPTTLTVVPTAAPTYTPPGSWESLHSSGLCADLEILAECCQFHEDNAETL